MCGRFTLTADPSDLQEAFYWVNFGSADFAPRYNIAPTQQIDVVYVPNDKTLLAKMRWYIFASPITSKNVGRQ